MATDMHYYGCMDPNCGTNFARNHGLNEENHHQDGHHFLAENMSLHTHGRGFASVPSYHNTVSKCSSFFQKCMFTEEHHNPQTNQTSHPPIELFPPENNGPSTTFINVALCHKPRGSKGVWHNVQKDERLRVTKNKGKRLRLRCTCDEGFNASTVEVFTVDISDPLPRKDGVIMEKVSVSEDGKALEVDLKLFLALKQFQFSLRCLSKDDTMRIAGNTVRFTASSSGGTRRVDEHRAAKKRKLNIQGQSRDTSVESPAVVPSSLDVYGFVRAKSFHQMSDLRLKKDVRQLQNGLAKVRQLGGKTYRWRHDDSKASVVGLIAQEVRRVVPEVVAEDPSGLLSVNYSELVPVLIEAVKELDTRQTEHHKTLQQLSNKEEEITQLKRYITSVDSLQQELALYKRLTVFTLLFIVFFAMLMMIYSVLIV